MFPRHQTRETLWDIIILFVSFSLYLLAFARCGKVMRVWDLAEYPYDFSTGFVPLPVLVGG